jgi:RNA polymerase sigma-70 factor (ECF subfamily)
MRAVQERDTEVSRNRNVAADETILKRIAAGDPAAVVDCMNRYGGLVWSLVRARIRNAADAEDATQEIFIELWKSAPRFDPAVASEAVFIAMIARRRLIDRLRARSRQPVTEEFDEELARTDPLGTQAADASDVDTAARAVATLEAGQREVVLLSIVQGMSHSEIATATGKPLGTVKTSLRRGLAKVRALLEPGRPQGFAAEGGE